MCSNIVIHASYFGFQYCPTRRVFSDVKTRNGEGSNEATETLPSWNGSIASRSYVIHVVRDKYVSHVTRPTAYLIHTNRKSHNLSFDWTMMQRNELRYIRMRNERNATHMNSTASAAMKWMWSNFFSSVSCQMTASSHNAESVCVCVWFNRTINFV